MVNVVHSEVGWAVWTELFCDDKKIIILNVCIPYERIHNEDEYLSRLTSIMSFIPGNCFTCSYVLGDFNAHVSDDNSFCNHLL